MEAECLQLDGLRDVDQLALHKADDVVDVNLCPNSIEQKQVSSKIVFYETSRVSETAKNEITDFEGVDSSCNPSEAPNLLHKTSETQEVRTYISETHSISQQDKFPIVCPDTIDENPSDTTGQNISNPEPLVSNENSISTSNISDKSISSSIICNSIVQEDFNKSENFNKLYSDVPLSISSIPLPPDPPPVMSRPPPNKPSISIETSSSFASPSSISPPQDKELTNSDHFKTTSPSTSPTLPNTATKDKNRKKQKSLNDIIFKMHSDFSQKVVTESNPLSRGDNPEQTIDKYEDGTCCNGENDELVDKNSVEMAGRDKKCEDLNIADHNQSRANMNNVNEDDTTTINNDITTTNIKNDTTINNNSTITKNKNDNITNNNDTITNNINYNTTINNKDIDTHLNNIDNLNEKSRVINDEDKDYIDMDDNNQKQNIMNKEDDNEKLEITDKKEENIELQNDGKLDDSTTKRQATSPLMIGDNEVCNNLNDHFEGNDDEDDYDKLEIDVGDDGKAKDNDDGGDGEVNNKDENEGVEIKSNDNDHHHHNGNDQKNPDDDEKCMKNMRNDKDEGKDNKLMSGENEKKNDDRNNCVAFDLSNSSKEKKTLYENNDDGDYSNVNKNNNDINFAISKNMIKESKDIKEVDKIKKKSEKKNEKDNAGSEDVCHDVKPHLIKVDGEANNDVKQGGNTDETLVGEQKGVVSCQQKVSHTSLEQHKYALYNKYKDWQDEDNLALNLVKTQQDVGTVSRSSISQKASVINSCQPPKQQYHSFIANNNHHSSMHFQQHQFMQHQYQQGMYYHDSYPFQHLQQQPHNYQSEKNKQPQQQQHYNKYSSYKESNAKTKSLWKSKYLAEESPTPSTTASSIFQLEACIKSISHGMPVAEAKKNKMKLNSDIQKELKAFRMGLKMLNSSDDGGKDMLMNGENLDVKAKKKKSSKKVKNEPINNLVNDKGYYQQYQHEQYKYQHSTPYNLPQPSNNYPNMYNNVLLNNTTLPNNPESYFDQSEMSKTAKNSPSKSSSKNKKPPKAFIQAPNQLPPLNFSTTPSPPMPSIKSKRGHDIDKIFEFDSTLKTFKCLMCDYKVKRKNQLGKHLHNNHQTFLCTQCNQICEDKNSLETHLTYSHPPKNTHMLCKKCRQHVAVGEWEKHQCADVTKHCSCCGKDFRNSGSFKNHMRKCLEGSKINTEAEESNRLAQKVSKEDEAKKVENVCAVANIECETSSLHNDKKSNEDSADEASKNKKKHSKNKTAKKNKKTRDKKCSPPRKPTREVVKREVGKKVISYVDEDEDFDEANIPQPTEPLGTQAFDQAMEAAQKDEIFSQHTEHQNTACIDEAIPPSNQSDPSIHNFSDSTSHKAIEHFNIHDEHEVIKNEHVDFKSLINDKIIHKDIMEENEVGHFNAEINQTQRETNKKMSIECDDMFSTDNQSEKRDKNDDEDALKGKKLRKSYVCEHCPKMYRSKQSLKKHWLKKHEEVGFPSHITPIFACDFEAVVEKYSLTDKEDILAENKSDKEERECGLLEGGLKEELKGFSGDEINNQVLPENVEISKFMPTKIISKKSKSFKKSKCKKAKTEEEKEKEKEKEKKAEWKEKMDSLVIPTREMVDGWYVCVECQKKFKSLERVLKHEETHSTVEKIYKCDWPGCSKAYFHYSNLYSHRSHHITTKPFSCSLCSCAYWQKCSLNSHKARVHGLQNDSSRKKLTDATKCESSSEDKNRTGENKRLLDGDGSKTRLMKARLNKNKLKKRTRKSSSLVRKGADDDEKTITSDLSENEVPDEIRDSNIQLEVQENLEKILEKESEKSKKGLLKISRFKLKASKKVGKSITKTTVDKVPKDAFEFEDDVIEENKLVGKQKKKDFDEDDNEKVKKGFPTESKSTIDASYKVNIDEVGSLLNDDDLDLSVNYLHKPNKTYMNHKKNKKETKHNEADKFNQVSKHTSIFNDARTEEDEEENENQKDVGKTRTKARLKRRLKEDISRNNNNSTIIDDKENNDKSTIKNLNMKIIDKEAETFAEDENKINDKEELKQDETSANKNKISKLEWEEDKVKKNVKRRKNEVETLLEDTLSRPQSDVLLLTRASKRTKFNTVPFHYSFISSKVNKKEEGEEVVGVNVEAKEVEVKKKVKKISAKAAKLSKKTCKEQKVENESKLSRKRKLDASMKSAFNPNSLDDDEEEEEEVIPNNTLIHVENKELVVVSDINPYVTANTVKQSSACDVKVADATQCEEGDISSVDVAKDEVTDELCAINKNSNKKLIKSRSKSSEKAEKNALNQQKVQNDDSIQEPHHMDEDKTTMESHAGRSVPPQEDKSHDTMAEAPQLQEEMDDSNASPCKVLTSGSNIILKLRIKERPQDCTSEYLKKNQGDHAAVDKHRHSEAKVKRVKKKAHGSDDEYVDSDSQYETFDETECPISLVESLGCLSLNRDEHLFDRKVCVAKADNKSTSALNNDYRSEKEAGENPNQTKSNEYIKELENKSCENRENNEDDDDGYVKQTKTWKNYGYGDEDDNNKGKDAIDACEEDDVDIMNNYRNDEVIKEANENIKKNNLEKEKADRTDEPFKNSTNDGEFPQKDNNVDENISQISKESNFNSSHPQQEQAKDKLSVEVLTGNQPKLSYNINQFYNNQENFNKNKDADSECFKQNNEANNQKSGDFVNPNETNQIQSNTTENKKNFQSDPSPLSSLESLTTHPPISGSYFESEKNLSSDAPNNKHYHRSKNVASTSENNTDHNNNNIDSFIYPSGPPYYHPHYNLPSYDPADILARKRYANYPRYHDNNQLHHSQLHGYRPFEASPLAMAYGYDRPPGPQPEYPHPSHHPSSSYHSNFHPHDSRLFTQFLTDPADQQRYYMNQQAAAAAAANFSEFYKNDSNTQPSSSDPRRNLLPPPPNSFTSLLAGSSYPSISDTYFSSLVPPPAVEGHYPSRVDLALQDERPWTAAPSDVIYPQQPQQHPMKTPATYENKKPSTTSSRNNKNNDQHFYRNNTTNLPATSYNNTNNNTSPRQRNITTPASNHKRLEEAYRQAAAMMSGHSSNRQPAPPPPPLIQPTHPPNNDLYPENAISGFNRYYYSAAMYRSQQRLAALQQQHFQQQKQHQQLQQQHLQQQHLQQLHPEQSSSFVNLPGFPPNYLPQTHSNTNKASMQANNKYKQAPQHYNEKSKSKQVNNDKGVKGGFESTEFPGQPHTDPYRQSVIYNMIPKYF